MHGPVVVGGSGGSGTRVVAQALMATGVDLGPDRNDAEDNRWFTLLLKRPRWFGSTTLPTAEVGRAMDAFLAVSTGSRALAAAHRGEVAAALAEAAARSPETRGLRRPLWAARRLRSLLRHAGTSPHGEGWGWKEPNTHLFLPAVAARLPDVRYVHVLRHGLDMAWSSNQNQLRHWAPLHGLPVPGARVDPGLALEWWLRSNRDSLATARGLGLATHVLRFDDLLDDPVGEFAELLDFIGAPGADPTALAELVQRPGSAGRHRDRPLEPFSPTQLAGVQDLGFEVHGDTTDG